MIDRRQAVLGALAALVVAGGAAFVPAGALAQEDYPSRTISFVCAFPPGSGADVLVRYFADKISAVAGETVIVENKPGALSNIAAEYTARAKPDGYTVFVHAGNSIAGNMHILKNPPIDVRTDLRTIATVNKQAFMIAVAADGPYKTLDDLVKAMKERGGDSTYGLTATSGKVLAEAFKQMTGIESVPVQYKTSQDSINDMAEGIIDWGSFDPVFALSQAREGRFRLLGVGAADRIKGAPDVPTLKEQGYDIDQLGWWGVMVPAATPEPIVQTLNGWFKDVLSQPETQAFLERQGGEAYISTPEESQALMERTVDEWKDYVAIAKIPQQ